jgi:sugar phosphate isomerase/epimerase
MKNICVNTNSLKHLSIKEACGFISALGYNFIEPTTDGCAHAYTYLLDKQYDRLKEILDIGQMKPVILSGGWADFVVGDLQYVESQVKLVQTLGVKSIRFFVSNPHIPIVANPQNKKRAVHNIHAIAKQYKNVDFLFENHGGMFHSFDDISEMMLDINLNNVGIVYDPANFIFDDVDPIVALMRTSLFVKHVHVKDITTDKKFVKVGAGITPWKLIVSTLRHYKYDGYYSVEFEGKEYSNEEKEEGLVRSLEGLERLLK